MNTVGVLVVAVAMALEATGVGGAALFAMTAGLVALADGAIVDGAELMAVVLETKGAEVGTAWVAAGAATPVGAAIDVAVMAGAVITGAATGWPAPDGVPATAGTGAAADVTGTLDMGVETAGWDVGAPAVASDMATSFLGMVVAAADGSMWGWAGVGATCVAAVALGALFARKSPKR